VEVVGDLAVELRQQPEAPLVEVVEEDFVAAGAPVAGEQEQGRAAAVGRGLELLPAPARPAAAGGGWQLALAAARQEEGREQDRGRRRAARRKTTRPAGAHAGLVGHIDESHGVPRESERGGGGAP